MVKIKYIFLLLIFFLSKAVVAKGKWHEKSASYRLSLIPDSKDKSKTKVGFAEFLPNNSGDNFSVYNNLGEKVKSYRLWGRKGDKYKILFDTSSNAGKYYVYLGKDIREETSWKPKAGLILETRVKADGNANNWKEATQVIAKSRKIQGRSLVDKVFQGINPHAQTKSFIASYKGYLNITEPGRYRFVIAADDAVFLFIDGKKLVEWPGWHGPWDGVKGKYGAEVNLKKGIHKFECINIQNGYGFNVVAGWRRPGKKQYEVIPPEAFVRIKKYVFDKYEPKYENSPPYFTWENTLSLITGGKAVVFTKFEVIGNTPKTLCRWSFDDGGKATGSSVTHLFLSTGIRKVKLEQLTAKGRLLKSVEKEVNIDPVWTQREQWSKHLSKSFRRRVAKIDFSKYPAKDLYNLVMILDEIKDRNTLAKVGKICLKRSKEFADKPSIFFRLSQTYIHYSIREYQLADQAYKTILDKNGADKQLIAKTKLYYAALKIHNYGKADEGIRMLKEIDDSLLTSQDCRKKMIWYGDAVATKGDIEGARQIFFNLPNVVDRSKSKYNLRNEAHIHNALDFLRRKEYDEAEKLVWWIEWEFPEETLNPSTGLIMIKIFIGRKEYNYALWRCIRLMNAAQTDRQMSDILLCLVEIYYLKRDLEDASGIFKKLLKDYPYSEAAAIAKDKWENKIRK